MKPIHIERTAQIDQHGNAAPDTTKPAAQLFHAGRIIATPGAMELLDQPDGPEMLIRAGMLLHRHTRGDFGDICDEDKQSNLAAIVHGSRVLSSYKIADRKLWVITEADRSVTTLLLPEEY